MYPCMHSNVHYMYYAYNVQYKYINKYIFLFVVVVVGTVVGMHTLVTNWYH